MLMIVNGADLEDHRLDDLHKKYLFTRTDICQIIY